MNYKYELEKTLDKIVGKPTLLLHSCCGPCSSYVIEFLAPFFEITIFYYNPNIEPKSEYLKRKNTQISLIEKIKSKYKIDFLDCDYDHEVYEENVAGIASLFEGEQRCDKCIEIRLLKLKNAAKENNFKYFGTTLSVSPHKNAKVINEIGLLLEDENSKFLVADFKKDNGYLRSIELSKEYGLYRQDYCGCLYFKNKLTKD